MPEHHLYIRRCLELAQLAKGHTAPNPMVGAVLVHNGRIIGEGWHREYGGPHAEVNCLESVNDADKALIPESTMYVSLEPCAHHGKTPPCATRLVQERVKEVVICNIDPFALVEGRGLKILEAHGIGTTHGIGNEEGLWVNRRFFCFHTNRRPYIILKWAQTGQGYFAPLDRSRYQITGKESRQLVHKWRTEEAAIMIGHKTALSDDPQLTARYWSGKQPLRIVLDKNLVLPHHLQVFNADAQTWVINEKKSAVEGHITYVQLPFDEILLTRITEKLHEANILSLIVEGGAALLQSFIESRLWDEARVFTSDNLLPEGIAAPTLKNAHPAYHTDLANDRLHLYINNESKYKYPGGLPL